MITQQQEKPEPAPEPDWTPKVQSILIINNILEEVRLNKGAEKRIYFVALPF